jgi:hypothetical protein
MHSFNLLHAVQHHDDGAGLLQQKCIHSIDCLLCSVMMIKLVCHGVDDWQTSKRIDFAAKRSKVHSV